MRSFPLLLIFAVATPAFGDTAARNLSAFLSATAEPGSDRQVVWMGRIRARGFSFPDNGIFNSLQAGISLSQADPGFSASPAAQGLDRGVDRFIRDSAVLGDPEGSIGYWPAIETKGRRIRSFGRDEADLPADVDDSAIAAIWLIRRNRRKDWVAKYLELLPRWSRPGEGGFYTWVENRKESRIPTGAPNDVDCVVQLNVNSSVGVAEKAGLKLPPGLHAETLKSCGLVAAALRDRKYPGCSTYYRFEGHFWHALARHVRLGNRCALDRALARERLLADSAGIKEEPQNLASFLFALKTLIPAAERDARVKERVAGLSARIEALLKPHAKGGYLPGGEASGGRALKGKLSLAGYVGYHSDAYTSALALEALLIP